MPRRTPANLSAVASLGLALLCGALQPRALAADPTELKEDKPAEEVSKNIQVLKGVPASQLLNVMHFMRASLGVRCDHCHVAENGKYWQDDKPAKKKARQMLQMVFAINAANFDGRPVVTCNTCHRGATRPVGVPAIGQGAFTNTTRDDGEAPPAPPLPSVEQILDAYVRALGGEAATGKVTTRRTEATLLRPKVVNSGTPKAAILNRAETWQAETYQKAPNKYLSVITTPGGVISQGFNGAVGWTRTAKGQSEASGPDLARLAQLADFYKDLRLGEQYRELTVIERSKIGEREVYVVEGRSREGKPVRLSFDATSGLLLRRTIFTEIKLGLDPEQTDFEDYRKVGDVWLPFTVRTSYLDDNHFGTTRTLTKVEANAPMDDAMFDPPAKQP